MTVFSGFKQAADIFFSIPYPESKQVVWQDVMGKKGDRLPRRKDPGKLFLVFHSYVHDPQIGLMVMVIQDVSNKSRYDFK